MNPTVRSTAAFVAQIMAPLFVAGCVPDGVVQSSDGGADVADDAAIGEPDDAGDGDAGQARADAETFDDAGQARADARTPDDAGGTPADANTSSETDAGGAPPGRDAGASFADGPRVLTMSVLPSRLGPDTSLTVSIVVAHDDGVGHLSGAILRDAITGSTLGTMIATAPGTFTITKRFDELDAMLDLAAPPGGAERVVRVVVYDDAGRFAERDAAVLVSCASMADTLCGGLCAPCDNPVGGHALCTSRRWVRTCDAADTHLCGNRCAADTAVDACGASCRACRLAPLNGTPVCTGGACDFTCNPGFHRCAGLCVGADDPTACGEMCTRCGAPENGVATCRSGVCDFDCRPGTHRCGNACLRDDDEASCGSRCTPCPTAPGAVDRCRGGECVLTCIGRGEQLCGGECRNVGTDPLACGPSCTRCATDPNADTTCVGGSCRLACHTGFATCGRDAAPMCCTHWSRHVLPATAFNDFAVASFGDETYALVHDAYVGPISLRVLGPSGWDTRPVRTWSYDRHVEDFVVAPDGSGYGLLQGDPWTYDGISVIRFNITGTGSETATAPDPGGRSDGPARMVLDSRGRPVIAFTAVDSSRVHRLVSVYVLSSGRWVSLAPRFDAGIIDSGEGEIAAFAVDESLGFFVATTAPWGASVYRYDGAAWSRVALLPSTTSRWVTSVDLAVRGRVLHMISTVQSVGAGGVFVDLTTYATMSIDAPSYVPGVMIANLGKTTRLGFTSTGAPVIAGSHANAIRPSPETVFTVTPTPFEGTRDRADLVVRGAGDYVLTFTPDSGGEVLSYRVRAGNPCDRCGG